MSCGEVFPISDVSGVLWKKAALPCDITPFVRDDMVYMVLWYKNAETEPIYSFDVRNRPHNQAKLWSSPSAFGNRAVFSASPKPAQLHIDNVHVEDEAVYRCRVDFKNSPTRNVKVNFTVIIQPQRPTIYNVLHQEIETLLEHSNEGSTLSLICEVSGGRPAPEVSWYLAGKLIDNTYQREAPNLTVNQLNNLKLTRDHLNAQLTCEARNAPPSVEPVTKLVILNINLKPLKVEILQKSRALSAERDYEIECLAVGSRPSANISWYLGEKPVKHLAQKFPNADNQVISIMKYSPRIQDNGKLITCKAENPAIKDFVIEDKWTLNIQYFPQVTLKMGHNLDPRSIKEGDDVYFECEIRCNPKAFKQAWFHNGEEIHQNVTAGIILTDTSLVLQKVTKYASGNYTCMAANVEGKGTSNSVTLAIMCK
ncbi:hypothetical protein V9T40_006315 [Parthenolecanium corni]|uniref:Ig-like domain-containing protein n=1 Tax=Parthenolecanium corni TaxID=536013 RepID=A0AAN9TXM0_9HEMI